MKLPEKLYILPFDHRASFAKMFGFDVDKLTPEESAKLSDYKHVIFEGFIKTIEGGLPKGAAAILVDEQFGSAIHEEAEGSGYTHVLTIEKSGQDEFDFEYGERFGEHILKFNPQYVKVLVRYNSGGDAELNKRQIAKLKKAGEFCQERGFGFLFELLVPGTESQIRKTGSKEKYEEEMRGEVTRESIKELIKNGLEPDIWKLEGLDDKEQMQEVVGAATSGDKPAAVILLGRGEGEARVSKWIKVAAVVPGVIGIAVGRTVFQEPLEKFHAGKLGREEAASAIAKNFKKFVDVFEEARFTSPWGKMT